MNRRPPSSPRSATLFPDTPLFRSVAPLEPDEEESTTAIEKTGGDAVEAPITIDTASVPSVDYTSEQKYKVVLRGLNDVFDDQFRDRFDQLSVLRGGEDRKSTRLNSSH